MLLSQTQIRLLFSEYYSLLFPPSKTQPSTNLIPIGSFLFPFPISFGKCNIGMSAPINNETSVLLVSKRISFKCSNRWWKFYLNLYGIRFIDYPNIFEFNSHIGCNFDDKEKLTNFDLTFDFWVITLEKVIDCSLPFKFK